MNCATCHERLVAWIEGLLDEDEVRQVAAHLEHCAACRREAAEIQQLRGRLIADAEARADSSFELTVMDQIVRRQAFALRRSAMRRRFGFAGIAGAAAAVLALILIPWFGGKGSQATAAEVFWSAIRAASAVHSVHMKVMIRTLPYDNFEYIGLNEDFVPHDMWKEFGDPPRWRVEKPGRVVVMDGETSTLWIKGRGGEGGSAASGGPDTGYVQWLRGLLDVDQVLETQLNLAERRHWDLQLDKDIDADGRTSFVVTVEATAQGDFENDYAKNKSITESDNRRVYRFDADTHRLEGLSVIVHTDGGDVLVLEITDIEYDVPITPDLFKLDLPEDVTWFAEPRVLPDNEAYAAMSPQEVAKAFFTACQAQNWDEVLKFYPTESLPERLKDHAAGLELLSVGEPFQSGLYPGWFVPYEIKLRDGMIKKGNLALRNDNAAGRYMVDGGI